MIDEYCHNSNLLSVKYLINYSIDPNQHFDW